MDAPVGPEHEKADKALHQLFQEAGLVSAPSGMEARIMAQIAVIPRHVTVLDKPLLPKWAWGLAALGTLAAIVLFMQSDTTGGSTWSQRLPSFSLEGVLTSKWVLAGVGCAVGLLILETWLSVKRLAPQQH